MFCRSYAVYSEEGVEWLDTGANHFAYRVVFTIAEGLKWVRTHVNAVVRHAISANWRSQISTSAFFCENARFHAGKIALSIGTQLVNLNLVKITVWLEIQGARCKIERGPQIFTGTRDFFYYSTTLKLRFNPLLLTTAIHRNTKEPTTISYLLYVLRISAFSVRMWCDFASIYFAGRTRHSGRISCSTPF